MGIRVLCIDKSGDYLEDPHEAISHFGWINESTNEKGKTTRDEMWAFVNDGGDAFAHDAMGYVGTLVAKINSHGTPYVQTVSDGQPSDILLALPKCS